MPQSTLRLLLLASVTVIGVLAWKTFAAPHAERLDPNAAPRPVAPRGELGAEEQTTIALFERSAPSVVHITNLAVGYRSLDATEIPQGTGTGFIWDDRGYVVTNFHVVQGGDRWTVTLSDGDSYNGIAVGGAADYDIAVLKIPDAPTSKLRPLAIGRSSDLKVGQTVLAIGNPFGLDQTLTTGVISGLNRQIKSVAGTPISGVIQTDAAINPGNSGGPLLDSSGRLIGMNTSIVSPSGAYAGIGFAVPADSINRIVPELIRRGKRERAGLGVRTLDDTLVKRMVSRRQIPAPGAVIDSVTPRSAAAKAGLQGLQQTPDGYRVGDVIVAIDGKPIQSGDDLRGVLVDKNVGDQVKILVLRDGEKVEIPVTLQAIE